ncbi:MAG: hemolysin family protein [Thermoanaerobaculaceae bacterium]
MAALGTAMLVILALILLNGVLAMAEIAIVASRRARLEELAARGVGGARVALALASDPNRFLSTVQIGITLVGVLAGALGGLTVSDDVTRWLSESFGPWRYHREVAVGAVVVTTTFLSLVVGELVPKRLALAHAEKLAVVLAPMMRLLARVTAPGVWLLAATTNAVLRVLRVRGDSRQLTEEEIRLTLAEGAASGVLHSAEHAMVENVFRLGDLTVAELMTPRSEIVWLDIDDTPSQLWAQATASGRLLFPVCRGDLQNVIGIAGIADLVPCDSPADLLARLREPLFVPETTPAIRLPETFRQANTRIALVIDEHGAVSGLVSVTDVLKAIVGHLAEPEGADSPVVTRADGSWLVDGALPIRDLKELLGVERLPGEERRGYITAGGLAMHLLGKVPAAGDTVSVGDLLVEVVDMDGLRVDKLLIRPGAPPADERPE